MRPELSTVKALTFDVFGTVVDWRGSIAREMRQLARAKGLRVNAARFADAWRAGYRPAMDRVSRGELPWDCIFSAETFHHYKPDPNGTTLRQIERTKRDDDPTTLAIPVQTLRLSFS